MDKIESFHENIVKYLNGLEYSCYRCVSKIYSDPMSYHWRPDILSDRELVGYYNGFFGKIFGKDKIVCRLIHLETDICFNSQDREILYSIQELFKDSFSFRESFFGKCICGTIQKFRHVINNSFHLDFQVLNNSYLKYFKDRINLLMTTLTEQYPLLGVNPDYNQLKEQFSMSIPKIIYYEKIIDLQPLYSNREGWEQLRKKIINNKNNY